MGEQPYKKMNELVYVLCVESVVFAAVSITIVAQRLNVFDWPESSTWPVFGTTIQIILLYSLFILLIMCFVHANRFNDFVIETCQACAKTIGRLMSVIVIFTASMCALVWLYDKVDWALILCQFWGTSCATSSNPGRVLWSWTYSVYLAILLPLFAVQAGLQMTAASLLKNVVESPFAPRRVITINCALILTLHATHTVDQNFVIGCSDGCNIINNSTVFTESPGDVVITSSPILFGGCFLFVLDITADICSGFLSDDKNLPSFIIFIIVRCLQISFNPIFLFITSIPLPDPISWSYLGLTGILSILDIIDVTMKYMKHVKKIKPSHREVQESVVKPTSNLFSTTLNSAFTVEPARRRRFMLTYAGVGRPLSNNTTKDALYPNHKRLKKKQV